MAKRATTNRRASKAPASRSAVTKMVKAGDNLENLISGLGTEKDKMFNTAWTYAQIDPGQLDAAYRGDWIARKLVDIPAADATREWRSWQGLETEEITIIEGEEQRLQIQQKLKHALQKARLYGGGALVLGINQGTNEQEVNLEQVGEGDLAFVHAVSRYDITAGPMEEDLASPYYGEPTYYERTNGTSGMVRFHPSRVVPFRGLIRQDHSASKEFWGDSIIQAVGDAIKGAGLVTASIAQLVSEAKVEVIKVPELSENMSTTGYEQLLARRWGLANVIKGVHSMLLIDKEEEWTRHNSSFASLPEILQMYFLLVCGAADIPATRFFGQSPAGLSSTGESDIRNYYDSVGAFQKNDVSPMLWRLDEVLMRSALNDRPEESFYLWNSLWQMTDEQKVKMSKDKADVVKIIVDTGLIDANVMKAAQEAQLIEDSTFPGFEQFLEEFDGTEEEEAAEAGGMEPVIDPETGEPVIDPETGLPQMKPKAPVPANENFEQEEEEEPEVAAADARRKWKRKDRRNSRNKMRTADQHAALRKRFADATPKSLYVYRPVLNSGAILAWAKEQGFTSALLADDLHVTVIYSKSEVDWIKIGEDGFGQDAKGNLVVGPGGPRVVEQFGEATCLVFGSSSLSWRHEMAKHNGASSDYEDFNPHITITYKGAPADLSQVEPYRGEIVLGPEVFKEIKKSFDNDKDVPEKAIAQGEQVEEEEEEPAVVDHALPPAPAVPPITVNVTVAAPRKGKEVTTVTKHDKDGRIEQFERREVDDDEPS